MQRSLFIDDEAIASDSDGVTSGEASDDNAVRNRDKNICNLVDDSIIDEDVSNIHALNNKIAAAEDQRFLEESKLLDAQVCIVTCECLFYSTLLSNVHEGCKHQ